MQPATQTAAVSKKRLWAGRILSALPVPLMLFSAVMKFIAPPEVLREFVRLGYPQGVHFGIGILELACTLLYAIPQTSVLGAILLTGYLGGATATHVRVGDPLSSAITPAIMGVVLWLGLYLREDRLRPLVPLRK
jgi:uncharacterized MnhB-related membrane protein